LPPLSRTVHLKTQETEIRSPAGSTYGILGCGLQKGAGAMVGLKVWSAVAAGIIGITMFTASAPILAQGGDTVLKPADAEKLLPPSVFYRGQSATTQVRNSGGVKFADGYYVLSSLVDTSGYSTAVAAKYQAYFINEVPIKIGGHRLSPGAYGVGFIAGSKFVVTDLGAHDVFTVSSTADSAIKRPMPLQVLADPVHGFRLYAGRQYVVFER